MHPRSVHPRSRLASRSQTARTTRAPDRLGAWLLGGLAACGLLAASPALGATVDFDPAPETELNDLFQDGDTPGDGFEQLSGVAGEGTGDPASGAVVFSGTIPEGDFDLNESAVYTGSTFSLGAGEQVRFGGDLRFDALDADGSALLQLADPNTSPSPSSLGLFLTSGSDSALDLAARDVDPSEGDYQPIASTGTGTNGTTLDWLRLEGELAYDGSNLSVSATLSSIGPDGESAPTSLLSLGPTAFSNAGLEGSSDLFFLFGGLEVAPNEGGPAPAGPIYFDNMNVVPEPASALLIGGGLLGVGLARRRRAGRRAG